MKVIDADSVLGTLDAGRGAFERGDFELARLLATSVFEFAKKSARIINKRERSVDVSIVIVSHRCNDRTLALIKAADSWNLPFTHEVVVVLNDDEALRLVIGDICKNSVVVDSPVNLGASGGRNLGASVSSGQYFLFLDDDGWTDEVSLIALYDTCRQYNATGVRGRVLPRPGSSSTKPAHYEPGSVLSPSFMDIEGMTIWNARHFDEVGGFDLLLFGHEGFELYSRLLRWHGPHAFLYAPNATLLHDFSNESKSKEGKLARYEQNKKYLDYLGVQHSATISALNRYRNDPTERAIFVSSLALAAGIQTEYAPLVSFITTAKDAETFLAEYSLAIKRQGYQNFEVVFVDDHSDDGTEETIKRLWAQDSRLNYVKNDGIGRAAALNTALRNAKGEVCVVADADDLMVPSRLQWTLKYFEENPQSACVSFYIFNEASALRATRPFVSSPTSIRIRSFVGMPVSFPAFAFKRAAFTLPFNEELKAGIDCDWLFRHLAEMPELEGHLLPIATSYYRLHEGQITSRHRDTQMEVGYSHVQRLHSQYIDFDEERDRDTLLKLMGWLPLGTGGDIQHIYNYVLRFIGNASNANLMQAVREYMLVAAKDLHNARLKSDYTHLKNRLDAEQKTRAEKIKADKSGSSLVERADIVSDERIKQYEKVENEWLKARQEKERSFKGLRRLLRIKMGAKPPEHFDERVYLEMYEDVRKAVEVGAFECGFHHFVMHGREEGRARPLARQV